VGNSFYKFLGALRNDLPEQFKGKPNIDTFQTALAKQLADVYEFFETLLTLRTLQTAEGAQLDGIGDIVCLTRTEALVVSDIANQNVPMEDEVYRRYLAWKIGINTSNSTYNDVYTALKMFWDNSPLIYSENLAHPATIFFDTPTLSPQDNAGVLLLAPKVKAAGVALDITAITENAEMGTNINIIGKTPVNFMITELPPYLQDMTFSQDVIVSSLHENITQSTLPEIT